MSLCEHICVFTTCVYMHMSVCAYTCKHFPVHVNEPFWYALCVCADMCLCVHVCVYILYVRICVFMSVCSCLCAYEPVSLCKLICAGVCTCFCVSV